MIVIPVIDYLQGNVVLAQQGTRCQYQPISSSLSPKSDLNSVLEDILSISTFNTIYIADLDCIENKKLDKSVWPKICSQYPLIEFWIDLGDFASSWNDVMHNSANARPVIGTESFSDTLTLSKVINNLESFNPLLSVDTKDDKILGPENLF